MTCYNTKAPRHAALAGDCMGGDTSGGDKQTDRQTLFVSWCVPSAGKIKIIIIQIIVITILIITTT